MAEIVNLVHDQGSTFSRRFIWMTDDATPTLVDVTNYTARMHVRTAKDAATITVELTTENGRILLGTTDGVIDLLLAADTTTAIPAPATYYYDLELVSDGGVVTRLVEGKLKLRPEVTR